MSHTPLALGFALFEIVIRTSVDAFFYIIEDKQGALPTLKFLLF
jgi:hypothetical protein